MKILYKIIAVVLGCALVVACSDDLNTSPDGDSLTKDQIDKINKNDPELFRSNVNGLYSLMIEYGAISGWYGSTRHFDYGYASVMMMLDAYGQDVPSENSGYNWYGSEQDMTDHINTSAPMYFIWNNLYKQMGAANDIIRDIPSNSESELLLNFRGQALAIRAFDLLNLVQLYQFTYDGHENEPGVPIVLETTTLEEVKNNPRATVAKVYEQILSDLEEAIAILPESNDDGSMNQYVAYGLRARANLLMKKYDDAYNDAVAAVGEYTPYSIDEVSKPSFNAFNHAWLWGNVIGATNDIVLSGLLNFPAHMCSFTGNGYAPGYAGRYINKDLYNEIPSSDVRKGWWALADTVVVGEDVYYDFYNTQYRCPNVDWTWSRVEGGDSYNIAEYEFWQAPYVNVKFGPYQDVYFNGTNACDFPLMRVEEMLLIQAEAKGLSDNGSVAEGKSILESFVQTYRDPSYTCTATSKEDFIDEIWMQRRVEFWGEGLSWFDIMRLKKPVIRMGTNFDSTVQWNLKAESPIFLLQIPENETNNNSACVNNPVVGAPTVGDTF